MEFSIPHIFGKTLTFFKEALPRKLNEDLRNAPPKPSAHLALLSFVVVKSESLAAFTRKLPTASTTMTESAVTRKHLKLESCWQPCNVKRFDLHVCGCGCVGGQLCSARDRLQLVPLGNGRFRCRQAWAARMVGCPIQCQRSCLTMSDYRRHSQKLGGWAEVLMRILITNFVVRS